MGNLWGRDLYAVIFAASFVSFGILFFVAWGVSAYLFRRVWPKFLVQEKADWASRVNSQIHAFIVVPGFLATLATTHYDYQTWYNDGSDIVPSSVLMAISLGYFSFDFFVLVYYRIPLWIVFVGHHVVASAPYFTYLFNPCESGNIVLSCFLLVEAATLFLNFQTWMEKLGYAKTKWFTWMFYLTYISWLLTRVLLPIFLLYVVWKLWLSDVTVSRDLRVCLIPGFVCSHLIAIFCWVVFFFVLTPDMIQRWKETPEAVELRLQDARRRRRSRLASRDISRSTTPAGGVSVSVSRRSVPSPSAISDGSHDVHASTTGNREPIVDFELTTPTHDRDDDDDVADRAIADTPLGLLDDPIDYEAMLQTMMTDNPYMTRPDRLPQLRTLTLEDLRREGISLDSRVTAYATTTIRL